MKIKELISFLEFIAPISLQEDYDNCGLITGNKEDTIQGILTCLDCTKKVVAEAIEKKCNLIIAHHPLIFHGLKKITGSNEVERTLLSAIKNEIAIYALHTNLDHIAEGVNAKIAQKIGLINGKILAPKQNLLKKLVTYVPEAMSDKVRNALFEAGAGNIGNYSHCSFNEEGIGTFKGNENSNPFVGKINEEHHEKEIRIETVFPTWKQTEVLKSLFEAHPYEEVAYDIYAIDNTLNQVGAGFIGELNEPMATEKFFHHIKDVMQCKQIKYTDIVFEQITKVAICGGSGGFLLQHAMRSGAQVFITSDIKYHQFFEANQQIILIDIGHYESEQFTADLILETIIKKFPNFAALPKNIGKSEINTNPIKYL